MQRNEVIQVLEDQMVKDGSDRKEARSILETYSTPQLVLFHEKRAKQSQPQPDTGKVRADAQRERINLEMERALEFEKDVMAREQAVARKRKAESDAALPQDMKTFAEATRQFRISGVQANFALIREVLGFGFTLYGLRDAIQAKTIHLAPATQSELDQWAEQAVEERKLELLRLAENDPSKLRAIVREEAAQARAATAQAEAEERFQAEQVRDSQLGYPKLPEFFQGQKLDAEFIRRCPVETHKFLARRFGNAQITARLNGRG